MRWAAARLVTGWVGGLAVVGALSTPNLSGRWQLNQDLSEDPQEKLQEMREGMERGDRGGGMGRGGMGGGMGRGGMGRGMGRGGMGGMEQMRGQMQEAQRWLREAPATVVITHEEPKLVLVEGNGHIRTLYTDKRKVKDGDREVRAKWDHERVVAETRLGDAVKVIETYELAPGARRLVIDVRMETSMMGRSRAVSVRRVYDLAVSAS